MLNADTGLIGMPQQTMGNGVNIRILINPNVKLGGLIRLDQASVYRTALSADEIGNSAGWITEQDNNGNRTVTGAVSQQTASINTDGDYIVGSIDYHGDTRGRPGIWICYVLPKVLLICSRKQLCRRCLLVIKKALLAVLLASPLLASAKGMQCGPFRLEAANDGFMHINGQKPETQK